MEETKKRRRPSQSAQVAIDAAADKMRDAQQTEKPVVSKPVAPSEEKMSFEQYWMVMNKKLRMPLHMKEILLADFKANGAGKMESEERYNEFLRIFGYKV